MARVGAHPRYLKCLLHVDRALLCRVLLSTDGRPVAGQSSVPGESLLFDSEAPRLDEDNQKSQKKKRLAMMEFFGMFSCWE